MRREQKAARAYAEFDHTDPFAYMRILHELQQGNCSLGSAEELLKDASKRKTHAEHRRLPSASRP